MLASMPAWLSRPVSIAAKPGNELFERAGMHIVILVPPPPGLGLSTSLALGTADPLAAGLAEAGALATALGALDGLLGAAAPPQPASSSPNTTQKSGRFIACVMLSEAS